MGFKDDILAEKSTDQIVQNREDQRVCLDERTCLTLIAGGNQTLSESTTATVVKKL